VLVNLIVADTSGSGFLAIYANGIGWPGTSNLVWSGAGTQQSVTTLAAVDAAAKVALYANVATNVIIDVVGYYR
jgi:hypothetical protein